MILSAENDALENGTKTELPSGLSTERNCVGKRKWGFYLMI